MKISIRKIFLLLAIVMSFVLVQASWAIDCSTVVEGMVNVITETGAITVGDTTVYGVPVDWGIVEVGDSVVINAHLTKDDKLVACYLTVDGSGVIELRPRTPIQLIGQSVTVAADSDCTCDNCYCNCPDVCEDCICDCSCDCICDGTGPHGPKGAKK